MPGLRKLGRATAHRQAMLRAMVTSLLEHGRIETTWTRAKEVQAMTEKMITTAKRGDLHSKRQVYSYITNKDVAHNLTTVIALDYEGINGGYTRVLRTGTRRGDGAEMAIIELVDHSETKKSEPKAPKAKKVVEEVIEDVKEEAKEIIEDVEESVEEAKDAVEEAVEEAKEDKE